MMSREIQHDLHSMEFYIQSKHQGLRQYVFRYLMLSIHYYEWYSDFREFH